MLMHESKIRDQNYINGHSEAITQERESLIRKSGDKHVLSSKPNTPKLSLKLINNL